MKNTLTIPQNLKFRKFCKKFGSSKGIERRTSRLWYSSCFGLVAKESGRLTPSQIKTMLMVITKGIKIKKRKRKVLACSVFLRVPLTKKPLGSRMGRGKGGVDRWVFPVVAGRVLVQIYGRKINFSIFAALSKVSYKLPILTKVVMRFNKSRSCYLKKL